MESLSPEEYSRTAQAAYKKGDHQDAADKFQQAAAEYRAKNDLVSAAEMDNNQSVALLQGGDPQAALKAALGSDAIFEEAGESVKQAMAFGNQAAAHDALNQYEEAETAYRKSAEMLSSLGENDLHAELMRSYSAMQLRTGRKFEALASMQSGIEGVEKPSLKQRALKKLLNIPFSFLKK